PLQTTRKGSTYTLAQKNRLWFRRHTCRRDASPDPQIIPIARNKFTKAREIFEAKLCLEIAANLDKLAKSKTKFCPKRSVDFMNLFLAIGITLAKNASFKENLFLFLGLFMRLSRYLKNMLFESFYPSFWFTSWPAFSSMSCEVNQKSAKKSFEKSNSSNSEIAS
ncbi:MAG: hypothetical protein K940chlam6_01693, partial [Chlamydiae bacterium]|nr:hypothetical protein [Chlamydiota bacterium]